MNKKKYYFIYLLLLWPVSHVVYICWDGMQQPERKAAIAVILGTTVHEDGTLSARLEQRMLRGLELYQQGLVRQILVSGGLGKEGHYEAEKMKDFLIANGVLENKIIVDNFGNNTEKTVRNTLKLRSELGFDSIVIVSQYFHITRTKMLFRKSDFTSIQGASPNYFEVRDFYSCFREFVAFYWLILR